MKNAEEFISALLTDGELAEKVNNAISQCKTEEDAIKAVIDFAKTQGYGFDAAEFAKAKAKIREISDKDLDKVAGGITCGGYATRYWTEKGPRPNDTENFRR